VDDLDQEDFGGVSAGDPSNGEDGIRERAGNTMEPDLFSRRARIILEATVEPNSLPRKSLGGLTPHEAVYGESFCCMDYSLPNGKTTNGEEDKNNGSCGNQGNFPTNGEPGTGETPKFTQNLGNLAGDPTITIFSIRKNQMKDFVGRKLLLSIKTMRRILAFKESIMKYGVFVPRNDQEADASPEHIRWDSGRVLEWIRLQDQGTFERNWDWDRVQKSFPNYKKKDVGHVFFVYDFKHSGEHRVRLVFDGSRQNPETYTDTYAPTARGESVRLFHIFAVEERWVIAQYDVPQAFLKSKIDCDIFVYPPKNFLEFPG
jgi:hypothetical protein